MRLELRLPGKQILTAEIDPEHRPSSETGRPGSILDMAVALGADIEHACGGFCACSTCHVIVRQGADSCDDPSEDEEDQLDEAPGVELHSRLACQCVPTGKSDLIIEVPEWNKNLVKEEKHDCSAAR